MKRTLASAVMTCLLCSCVQHQPRPTPEMSYRWEVFPAQGPVFHGTVPQDEMCGQVLRQPFLYLLQHTNFTGTVRMWYPNGQLLEVRPIESGKLHGTYEAYDANGHLTSKRVFVRGELVKDKGLQNKPPDGTR
jgi:antitoxin component YwqK of YwqJK toxin-antitoxin module